MTITNYNTLLQAIRDEAEDDGQEFSTFLPTAVDLAEERLFRELDLGDLEVKASGTLSGATLTKPSRYGFTQYIYIIVDGVRSLLKKRRESYIQDYWPNPVLTGIPKYYADASETELVLAPTPNANYSYEIKFTQKPNKLSTTNATNYYVTNARDVLLAACMVEMCQFMKAWDQVPIWEQKYVQLRDTWNIQAMRKRTDATEVPNSPENANNTLKHVINSAS